MRRHPVTSSRQDSDILPLSSKAIKQKSTKRSSGSSSPRKKKSQKANIQSIFLNMYLGAIAIFILYHIILLVSPFLPKIILKAKLSDEFAADSEIEARAESISNLSVSEANITKLRRQAMSVESIAIGAAKAMSLGNLSLNEGNGNSDGTEHDNYQYRSKVTPLRFPEDYEKFTVRINTWKREEQLKLSIEHHSTCSAVAEIQIVWCLDQGDPPEWLSKMEEDRKKEYESFISEEENSSDIAPLIVVERHVNNTLNERFLELEPIPTAGVLSIDDDVIRPCIALHAAFLKWTLNPDRQVGFDARSHQIQIIENEKHDTVNNSTHERWLYAYMSTTEKSNKYSITLTRFSFLHRDYLQSYWTDMPSPVRDLIAEHFNCEDIAMSLWISSKTGDRPPLLADYWAVKSQIKFYVPTKISGGSGHKDIRNHCMDLFADLFHLKGKLNHATLRRGKDAGSSLFQYGVTAENWNQLDNRSTTLLEDTSIVIDRWKEKGGENFLKDLQVAREEAASNAFAQGLIEKSKPWTARFKSKE